MSDPTPLADFAAEFRAMAERALGRAMPELDGPPMCSACRATEVRVTGLLCPGCERARITRERRLGIVAALKTVPDWYRWASLGHKALPERVRDAAAVAAVRELAAEPELPRLVTLVGPTRAGKTILACALLHEHIRRGGGPSASSRAVWHARRARFESVMAVEKELDERRLGEHAPKLDLAHQASVLVLDEVGRERDHRWAFALINERYAKAKPTILTTPAPNEDGLFTLTQDGGYASRVFRESKLISVEFFAPGSVPAPAPKLTVVPK